MSIPLPFSILYLSYPKNEKQTKTKTKQKKNNRNTHLTKYIYTRCGEPISIVKKKEE